MFESSLCFRSIPKVPLTTTLSQLYSSKKFWLLLLLLFLALLGVGWVIQRVRAQRDSVNVRTQYTVLGAKRKRSRLLTVYQDLFKRFSKPKLILLLVGVIASLPLLSSAIAHKLLSADYSGAADAIVVLGRSSGLNEPRVYVAEQLWRSGQAPKIFISAGGDAPAIAEEIVARGVPRRVIDGENCSMTTQENALFSAAILQPQGIQKIVLVTDSPHMMRSLLTFRAYGFRVIPHSSPLPKQWSWRGEALLRLRESVGVVGYGMRGIFFPHSTLEASSPELMNLLRQAADYGQRRSSKSSL